MSDSHVRDSRGNIFMDEVGQRLQSGDGSLTKNTWPRPTHLKVDGAGNDLSTEGAELGMDGVSVGWRCA